MAVDSCDPQALLELLGDSDFFPDSAPKEGCENYANPALRAVLQMYLAYQGDGERYRSPMLRLIQRQRDQLEQLLDQIEAKGEPALGLAQAGLEGFLEGLDLLQESLGQPGGEAAQAALSALQNSTNALLKLCPLDVEPSEEEPGPPLTTPNYQRLERATLGWNLGQMSDDELRAELDQVERNMHGHAQVNRQEMEDLEGLTEEEQELTLRLLGAIEAALQGSLAALAEMKLYWQDGQRSHVNRGMGLLGPPTQRMIEAFLALQTVTLEED